MLIAVANTAVMSSDNPTYEWLVVTVSRELASLRKATVAKQQAKIIAEEMADKIKLAKETQKLFLVEH